MVYVSSLYSTYLVIHFMMSYDDSTPVNIQGLQDVLAQNDCLLLQKYE